MIKRERYLDQLAAFRDTDLIKVITGMRRSGKSTLLELFSRQLAESGVPADRIIRMNFESFEFSGIHEYRQMYRHVREKAAGKGRCYLLLDEVQMVDGWEKAVNAFRVDLDVDITIIGSNAHLLSSELSTLLSGRYVEIHVWPLSFREYLAFAEAQGDRPPLDPVRTTALWNRYLQYGGLPVILSLQDDPQVLRAYLAGIYSTVILKDVVIRNQVRDGALLERIMAYLAGNIGNPVNTKKISDYLGNTGHKTTPDTVDSYLRMLQSAYIIHRADRYDTRGKALLKTNAKYYLTDTGLRNELLGFGQADYGRVYENVVFIELLRRGYQVTVGKIGNLDVDFIATRSDAVLYVQVTASLTDPATRERELRPLLDLGDNYEKIILSMDVYPQDMNDRGIKLKNLVEFLLEG
ncbi:MAG: ATP-binding protein [Clostridia bacterium]|nr:ATP-binding protein [Clostridia bacterium]